MRKAVPDIESPDPTFYPVEERVGEDILQRWIVEVLRPLVEDWLAQRREPAFVGADQFIYYERHNAHARVAPDVYVLPGVAPDTHVRSWKTWETGIVPSFALEVVSQDWEKDYVEAPARYAALGVAELVLFDPATSRRGHRFRFQVFRRAGKRLTRIEVSQSDRIRSKTLGCFLREVGKSSKLRLRLGTGPRGASLFPTREEAALAAKDAAIAAKEAALAAKEAADARIEELETELRRRH